MPNKLRKNDTKLPVATVGDTFDVAVIFDATAVFDAIDDDDDDDEANSVRRCSAPVVVFIFTCFVILYLYNKTFKIAVILQRCADDTPTTHRHTLMSITTRRHHIIIYRHSLLFFCNRRQDALICLGFEYSDTNIMLCLDILTHHRQKASESKRGTAWPSSL